MVGKGVGHGEEEQDGVDRKSKKEQKQGEKMDR